MSTINLNKSLHGYGASQVSTVVPTVVTCAHGKTVSIKRLLQSAFLIGAVVSAAGCASMNSRTMARMQAQIDTATQKAETAQQAANQAMTMAKSNEGQLQAMGGGTSPAQSFQHLGH